MKRITDPRMAALDATAREAETRMRASLAELKYRTQPKVLVADTRRSIATKAVNLAARADRQVRASPQVGRGIAAGLLALVLTTIAFRMRRDGSRHLDLRKPTPASDSIETKAAGTSLTGE